MEILKNHFPKHNMIWWFRCTVIGELTGDRKWVISPSKMEIMCWLLYVVITHYGHHLEYLQNVRV
jgi:hypothetical protein